MASFIAYQYPPFIRVEKSALVSFDDFLCLSHVNQPVDYRITIHLIDDVAYNYFGYFVWGKNATEGRKIGVIHHFNVQEAFSFSCKIAKS